MTAPVPAVAGSSDAKVKTVKVSVRNDSASPVTIQAGDQQYTLAPGKESKLKVPQGAQLTTVNATGTHSAGDVLGTANDTLSGNTLIVK